jgi:cell migration-inducing and hyaluronan-binding protein
LKLADNAIGMTPSAGDIGSSRFKTRLVDSLVVGETDNSGNPTTPEEVAYGRSLPKRRIPDFPIRGYGIARLSVESNGSRVTHSTTPSCV